MTNASNIGTDDELADRLRTYDDHVVRQRQRRTIEEGHQQDAEDDIAEARTEHVNLVNLQGQLLSDEKVCIIDVYIVRRALTHLVRHKSSALRTAKSSFMTLLHDTISRGSKTLSSSATRSNSLSIHLWRPNVGRTRRPTGYR